MGTEIFKLNADNGRYELTDYIKGDEEIDRETFAKIKERYPDKPESGKPTEAKILRLGISNPLDEEFIAYNNYVNDCRAEGRKKKADAATERATLKEITLPGIIETKIWVR